ncbi:GNAT family N-acetyltransferase [Larsenimonas suaedae]|uniref:GNAT family N-acetyltransferase n=1 Tax=Larsenimonas suaedae TaxID=1851019 RepID=A0ABU1GVH9_9GAMM|nr:GNAT family N-acetyltransferase [Larsenimonas suaedae]MCM2971885.1 GNAT family N-acetyltransferase [Larsenimonas suaedae]MDR5895437.1 GNAT family N-acetyltransferase [Larsenimonas suaedae]
MNWLDRLRFRLARDADGADQAEVFFHAIMDGASSFYSLGQRQAWANALPREAATWQLRQRRLTTFVADLDRRCVGFCELDLNASHIECLYVWPALQGNGIASRLIELACDHAREQGHHTLYIEASLMLAPRLLASGWESLGESAVEREGERLPRVRCKRQLNDTVL